MIDGDRRGEIVNATLEALQHTVERWQATGNEATLADTGETHEPTAPL
jgi:hypothetical protein